MELYTIALGDTRGLEVWENELRSVKLPYVRDGKKGLIRLGVGEVKLYKLFFPEDQLDTVMSLIGVQTEESYILKKHKKIKKIIGIVRKFLGLKKTPIPKKVMLHMQPNQTDKAVAVIPIGTRKDDFVDGNEQI